ncbi:hypothetical protein V8C86DRAFT_2964326 [Haematococcus lacustris]
MPTLNLTPAAHNPVLEHMEHTAAALHPSDTARAHHQQGPCVSIEGPWHTAPPESPSDPSDPTRAPTPHPHSLRLPPRQAVPGAVEWGSASGSAWRRLSACSKHSCSRATQSSGPRARAQPHPWAPPRGSPTPSSRPLPSPDCPRSLTSTSCRPPGSRRGGRALDLAAGHDRSEGGLPCCPRRPWTSHPSLRGHTPGVRGVLGLGCCALLPGLPTICSSG